MSAHEQDVDRVARAMTSGAPHATFTARVMAPIRGVPQPGFTGRVMARLESPPQRARSSMGGRAPRAALAMAAALTILAWLWRPGDVALPVTSAPVLVNASVGEAAFATPAPVFRPFGTPRVGRRTAKRSAPTAPQPFVTDVVSALDAPAPMAVPSITPLEAAVPSLVKPAPLSIPPLRVDKERP